MPRAHHFGIGMTNIANAFAFDELKRFFISRDHFRDNVFAEDGLTGFVVATILGNQADETSALVFVWLGKTR